jgi:hypothetical protein
MELKEQLNRLKTESQISLVRVSKVVSYYASAKKKEQLAAVEALTLLADSLEKFAKLTENSK